MSKFSVVSAPFWNDRPLAIVGTGPSLKGKFVAQIEHLGARVLAVNEAIIDLPFAHAVFSMDRPWIRERGELLSKMPMAKYLAVDPAFELPVVKGATLLQKKIVGETFGMSESPTTVFGHTSGQGALNLAYLKMAKRIALFGFDYSEGHYCEDRYRYFRGRESDARTWREWGQKFNDCLLQLRRSGTTVINCSTTSTVTAFRRVGHEAGLQWLRDEAEQSHMIAGTG